LKCSPNTTLVIGLADVTVINIYGESPGDLTDILETAVHAFIRMKQVDMQPSCHFVHQNVPAIMADKKGRFGRQQFQDKLDHVTKIVAEGELCYFTSFKEVIHFNSEQDVTFFPSLWKGDPPMAPVNSGYSDKAYILKQALLNIVLGKEKQCTINEFQIRLRKLWEAIRREKFAFSFKNSLEVIAYNRLDLHCGHWFWALKRKMLECQKESTHKINSCEASQIDITMQKCIEKAHNDLDTMFMTLTKQIDTFFSSDDNSETLIQWRKHTEVKLQHLLEDHKQTAKKYCLVLKLNREGRVKVDEIQQTYRITLHNYVTQLTINAQKQKYTQEQRQKFFDEQWNEWLSQLSKDRNQVNYATDTSIDNSIAQMLETVLAKNSQDIIGRLKEVPLSNRNQTLDFHVVPDEHLNSTRIFGRIVTLALSKVTSQSHRNAQVNDDDVCEAKGLTQQYLNEAEDNIEKVVSSIQDYDDAVANDVLMKLVTSIQQHNDKKNVNFKFTTDYFIDIAISVASFASRKMKEMVHKLRVQNDPIESLKKLRDIFFRSFESQFTAASNDKTAADNLCSLLATSIRQALMESLRIEIVDDMKKGAEYKRKNCFKIKILEDLLKRNDFSLYTTFLTNVSSSFRNWAKVYVDQHCKQVKDGETKLVKLAKQSLGIIIKKIIELAKVLERKYENHHGREDDDTHCSESSSTLSSHTASKTDDGDCESSENDADNNVSIDSWLNDFHKALKNKLTIDFQEIKQMIGVERLENINLFTKIFCINIRKEEEIILAEYKNPGSKSAQVTDWDRSPHIFLYTSLQGCKMQCPFCKEQCEYTDEDHIKSGKVHFTEIHRPQCLGRYTFQKSKKLVLDECTELVESDRKFCNEDTMDEYIPIKAYRTIYKDWFISSEKQKTGPIYWQWFCAKYKEYIEQWVGSVSTPMDSLDWHSLTEEDALKSLSNIYGSRVDLDIDT